MSLKPHPQFGSLQKLIQEQSDTLARPWKGLTFRCAGLDFASTKSLVSGEGTRQYGARWMAPGYERVVHLSTTELTAIRESKGHFSRYGLDAAKPEPRVLVSLELRVDKLLDLFRFDALSAGFTVQEMLDEDWETLNDRGAESLSQSLGRAAFSLGFEAILMPSARLKSGRNVVVFPENLLSSSHFAIVGEAKLKSWLG